MRNHMIMDKELTYADLQCYHKNNTEPEMAKFYDCATCCTYAMSY